MRSLIVSVLIVTGASPCLAQEKSGSIQGTVRFLGEVPPDQRIMTTDGGIIMHNDLVVDPKTKGLRFVAVYLEKAPEHKVAPRREKVVIDQRDMIFLPRVVAVQEGQIVRFENNDLCNHGVRATSLEKANVFSINTPPSEPYEAEFKAHKHPTIIDCPIHAWMKAYVFTFDHPFFAITDAKGGFKIANVPPGKRKLVFRHADSGTLDTRTVEVAAGRAAEIAVEWKMTGKQ